MKDRLVQSLARMEKDRLQAERYAQMLEETRKLFRERLDEIGSLRDDEWEDENLLDELNRGLTLLETVRSDYAKAMAKIDAVQPHVGGSEPRAASAAYADAGPAADVPRGEFRRWLVAGLGFTLPLMGLLAVLAAVWMALYFFA